MFQSVEKKSFQDQTWMGFLNESSGREKQRYITVLTKQSIKS